MMCEKIVFRLKGKELCWVSAKESSFEEVREIKGLLAYENEVNKNEIKAIYREA
jgi:hypothetical protein